MIVSSNHIRAAVAAAVIAIASLAGLSAATPAAAAGAIQVSGIQWVGLPCDNQAPVTFTMTGDLSGCWYGDSFTPLVGSPSGVLVATGTEHFVGCVAGQCGTLWFTFVFTGKYADPGVFLHELRGHCEHKIVASAGGLEGTTGFLRFTDDVVNNTSPYTGHLSLGGSDPAPNTTASTSATGTESC